MESSSRGATTERARGRDDMTDIESGTEVQAETTEQALARVEAECGWSDAVMRFAEMFADLGAATPAAGAGAAG